MGLGGRGWGVKNVFPHPNESLIWADPDNLVEIRLMVEVLDELGRQEGKEGQGRGCNNINKLSPSFWLLARLWLRFVN